MLCWLDLLDYATLARLPQSLPVYKHPEVWPSRKGGGPSPHFHWFASPVVIGGVYWTRYHLLLRYSARTYIAGHLWAIAEEVFMLTYVVPVCGSTMWCQSVDVEKFRVLALFAE